MLCWVLAGRAKKLAVHPTAPSATGGLPETFLGLLRPVFELCQDPTPEECARLESGFDQLFATQTGYTDLDQRIAKTRDKKIPAPVNLTWDGVGILPNPTPNY
jgi:hypothetical protein